MSDELTPCDHDGWRVGCPYCEAQHALALELLGEPVDNDPENVPPAR